MAQSESVYHQLTGYTLRSEHALLGHRNHQRIDYQENLSTVNRLAHKATKDASRRSPCLAQQPRASGHRPREAEIDWNRTTTLLTTKLYDKASELHIDPNDTFQAEYELTLEIAALRAQGKRRPNATVEEERAMRLRLYILEKKLAALRDLGNALLWVRADGRAVHHSPASCEIPGAGEEGVEIAVDKSRLEVAALAVKLSKKLALLKEEARKVKEAAATLEDLGWEPEEAPLTVMLLFS